MLDEQPAGWGRITLMALAGALVLGVVFYGLSRPAGPPQQIAETEGAATAQNPQPNPQQPSTTGQGAGDKGADAPGQGQAGQSKTPPAAGSSATSATGPGARPAPEAK
jgi:hypothetical protein